MAGDVRAEVDAVLSKFEDDYDTSDATWAALARLAERSEPMASGVARDDSYMHLISKAMMEILAEHTTLTVQHIEAWFRRSGAHIWVTGTENLLPETCTIVALDGSGTARSYALHIIIRKPALAMDEILAKGGGSYAASFTRLGTTGIMAMRATTARQIVG